MTSKLELMTEAVCQLMYDAARLSNFKFTHDETPEIFMAVYRAEVIREHALAADPPTADAEPYQRNRDQRGW